MRVRRVAGILLVIGLIGGAVAGFRATAAGEASGSGREVDDGILREAKSRTEREAAEGAHGHTALAAGESREVEATVEENAALAELIGLQQMAEGTGLELAPEQWVALAQVTRRTQVVRGAVEAELGAVQLVAPGRWRMDVPGYVETGAAMRARFFLEMGEVLGKSVAADVIDKLGPALEGYFAGFGVSLQTLDIVDDPRGGAGEWIVTRTVAYSKDAASGEQVAVRRETFFAGRGNSWVGKLRVEG